MALIRWRLPSNIAFRPRLLVLPLVLTLTGTIKNNSTQAQMWAGYGGNAQHTALSGVPSQVPNVVRWSTPVDDNPPFTGNSLYIHYGSPMITRKNTVIVPVRTQAGFQFKAFRGGDGGLVWPQPLLTDYILPRANWIPVCGGTLVLGGQKLAMPGAGGTVYLRTNPDRATGAVEHIAFYGNNYYNPTNKATLDSNVIICTPITADEQGNLYFGFTVTGTTPVPGLQSGGVARISASGQGTWISAAAATGDAAMKKVVINCAPAISNDGKTVYVAVNQGVDGTSGWSGGYLVALDSRTLSARTPRQQVRLKDPRSGNDAALPDEGSASPTVGPDGDVYFGVLENPFTDDRGWMLHFDAALDEEKTPGSFGWDTTASVVPASAVPSYKGTSSYLLFTKYNHYAGYGSGKGDNKLAILDPNGTQPDSIKPTLNVMKEVLTVLGVTPDLEQNPALYPNAVREWCINSAAIDPFNKCAIVNSEDGSVYRWDFVTNKLTNAVPLAAATGEAYTPTAIGPDGAVYAINRAVLNCCTTKK